MSALAASTLLARAAHLLALAVAPAALTPEPRPPAAAALAALFSLATLGALAAGALWLARRFRGRLSTAAAVAMATSIVAALAGAVVFSGARAPLGRGLFFVAAPLWLGLALAAAAVARRRRPMVWALLVAGLGAALHADAARITTSREAMWWEALRRDGDDPRALAALAGPLLRAHRLVEAAQLADRCAALVPSSCLCPRLRAEVEIQTRELDAALSDVGRAVHMCPGEGHVRAVLAQVLALRGDLDGAERQVQLGLTLGDTAAVRYAHALILERRRRWAEARAEAERAAAEGAGRDAALLAAALALAAGDLDDAQRRLSPLVAADPRDVEARYDLALVADRRDDYNAARQGYLAVLALDPRHPSARYNLAALAWRHGAADEARHHARKLAETFPGDARTARLLALLR